MEENFSNEQLIEMGVDPQNLNYPFGEMNIIVQLFGYENGLDEDGNKIVQVHPDIYQPRKNRVWSCGEHLDGPFIKTEKDKKDFVSHLRDSAERHKIMAYILFKQAEEIEKFGYPKTTLYYPE